MPNNGLWITDPETEEVRKISYEDLDNDTIRSFIKPIGGFIFPADLFLRSGLPKVPFYVRDWLPKRGKAMLYAPTKSGKSYLCQQLARCLGVGEPFLGIPTEQTRVLYVQVEMGEETFLERIRSTERANDNVYVGTTFDMKLDKSSGQEKLSRAISEVEPGVVILDPKYKMIVGNENESSEMRPVCDFLDTLIEDYKCSVFITDHTGMDESKRNRGSTVWEDWVDSLIRMKKTSKKGEPLRVKIEPIFLRHAQLPSDEIEAVLGEDFEFHLASVAPTIEQQVEKFIKEAKGPVSPRDLFLANIGSNTSVYDALKTLIKEGKIDKEGRGSYVCRKVP